MVHVDGSEAKDNGGSCNPHVHMRWPKHHRVATSPSA